MITQISQISRKQKNVAHSEAHVQFVLLVCVTFAVRAGQGAAHSEGVRLGVQQNGGSRAMHCCGEWDVFMYSTALIILIPYCFVLCFLKVFHMLESSFYILFVWPGT